ncbi:MAG: precorrin-2 C(20)-methyltransferase [Spirochaetia bacterium]|nr:precorrin-2 C(20)-methyltransferase [Spirochaetia bacterium]
MKNGKIYGVGVGPGDPELMTLRAVDVLNQVDVIVIPQSSKYIKSVAWRIAESHVGDHPEQEKLFLTFPMSKDPEKTGPAWETAFREIGERVQNGKSLAFISEGDPLFYSTFIYLLNQAEKKWPGCEVEIIPAVSSLTAVPAVIRTPIADGLERIAVLPASYGLEDLRTILDLFDTVFLMKVTPVMAEIIDILTEKGLLNRSVYVSRATMDGQSIVTDLNLIKNDKCDYFSMIMVSKKERSGKIVPDHHKLIFAGEK